MGEQTVNIHRFRHRSDTSEAPLRVAAVQLPRLEPEDRAALWPHIERDIEQHQRGG